MNFDPKKEISKLKIGEHWVWPESDYGLAEIWKMKDNLYFVYEIPQFGGNPIYFNVYTDIDDLIEDIKKWT